MAKGFTSGIWPAKLELDRVKMYHSQLSYFNIGVDVLGKVSMVVGDVVGVHGGLE